MKATVVTERAIVGMETFRIKMGELGLCSPAVETFADEVIVRITACGSPTAAVEAAMRTLHGKPAGVTV
jgi:hypothetical protein